MPRYTAPVKDIQFVLHDVLKVAQDPTPGYADLDEGLTAAVLEEAGKLASDVLAPLNAVGDRQGCVLENGVVRTPDGFRAAFDALREGGWTALDCDPDYGGQGLPYLMGTAVGEMFVSANMAFNMYQGLTHGAYSAIHVHGTADQKAMYLPKMVSCDWTGTMNLTEPHCGTDLGLMRTRAEPQADGSYRITGQKIFISAGDHDMAENIIHLVLAKAPGGGEGTKGISLFIVPKVLLNADGSLGARNAVTVGKIEEKMGIHGNATCVMNYDGATGWLLGDLHKGMRAMFTMMNEARLGVGLQGYAVAEAAYQNAAAYARDRLQGRAVTGAANPAGPADPLIVHPDIRRNLMDQKSFVEGARALTLWGASLIDRANRSDDAAADGLVSLMIPVIKGFQTDKGFEMAVAAQQVFGGHGYIEEWGMSQFARDARIAMIYEGANGVQALDLVGRKLAQDGGRHVMAFFEVVKAEVKAQEGDDRMRGFAEPLKVASKQLQQAAMFFMQNAAKNPNAALAGSTDFLHLMGHVCMGLMWTRMARAALDALDAGRGDRDFLQAKVATGRYYMARHLPACGMHLARIETGADPVMALAAEAF
ncbi:MAG TPA: acyl-CoA dehydrogenase C-terminal domain-containing protein [Paracoccaceae bacterium]|nr:acyl-CoA dehydrogenase C-terminal domain-containing protein [Paracoccaceae bacterium]